MDEQSTQVSPYRAIFFDLDGTLLPMEAEDFLAGYFRCLRQAMSRYDIDLEGFQNALQAGIYRMTTHTDGRLNADVFWETFFSTIDRGPLDWPAMVNDFYENEFSEIGNSVVPNPNAARAINTLQSKGYPLVLATMPLFPLRAVQERLMWAGIDPGAFQRITTYDNSTAAKPQLAFYKENLSAARAQGSEILMVGNNTEEDLVCLQVDMDAYLVTDFILDPINFDCSTVKHGSMADFASWVDTLPACDNPLDSIEPGPLVDSHGVSISSAGGSHASASAGASASSAAASHADTSAASGSFAASLQEAGHGAL